MNGKSLLLIAVLLPFAALTAVALKDHGYIGLLAFHFTATAGMQVIVDLVIVCVLAMIWMVGDAQRTGRTVWPYLLLTLTLGSFGPLVYLLVGQLSRSASKPVYA